LGAFVTRAGAFKLYEGRIGASPSCRAAELPSRRLQLFYSSSS